MILQQNPLSINWHCLLVGLFFIIVQCDARAVNVSNTWTMPQEGLNVFYRFFRDRISWFEADAVCQFHHANLVTVDNSFQFDATRDLLRELDVNDIVWIGLMRPQSSDRFMWSNSRPLVADTGYWAESLPLMDAPLCAVIDPIRDYRWHALRCGGPETASFLCEMPVPSWADACNLKDMPNLTLQYMADTASIELIRNCQEEGLLRTMCRGKQDRERALQDLICPRERLEAQRINDITNSHFKSLQIINSIPSDNNENNDIELLPMEINYGPHYPEELQTEKNTVQRLIEQFNVDELMQADEPSNMETVSSFYKIPGLIPKPVKKSTKKVLDYPKKDGNKEKTSSILAAQNQRDKKRLPLEMEEMMMGDQPLQGEPEMPEQFLNEEVSNEILEPLPHIKKTNIHKEDSMEKIEKETIEMKKFMQKSKEIENKKQLKMSMTTLEVTTTKPFSDTSTTTTDIPLTTIAPATTARTTEEVMKVKADHTHKPLIHSELDTNWSHLATTTTNYPVTIGHPMHPQQPHANVLLEESQHSHTKEATDNSHFIPPMLMVKSHYIPPASKHGHSEHDHHQHHHQQQQPSYEEHHLQLQTTTEEPASTAAKYEQGHTSDKMLMTVATPETDSVLSKINDKETTVSHKLEPYFQQNLEQQQLHDTTQEPAITTPKLLIGHQEEQHQVALITTTTTTTTTEKDNSMKPNTEPQTTPTELPNKSKNLDFEKEQTTPTATTLQSADSQASTTVEKHELTFLTSSSKDIEKYNDNEEGDKDKTLELHSPQISDTSTDTIQATHLPVATEKSLNSTQKLYNLETTTEHAGIIKEIADTTTQTETETMEPSEKHDVKQQQHLQMQKEKLAEIRDNKNKEYLQTTTATTEKQAATETAEKVPKTSTTVSQAATQQAAPTTAKTKPAIVTETLQQIEIDSTNKGKQEADKENERNKKETIVKTPDILQTSTAITNGAIEKEKQKEQEGEGEAEEEEEKVEEETHAPSTMTKSTTLTATAIVKPTTTTTPQNEIISTETSVSSTSTTISLATTTTTPKTTSEDITTKTTTLVPPSSTAISSMITASSPPAIITTTPPQVEVATATATARAETTSQTPAAPDTTRNFLKVTTEMPFKPNRRRTLTKPETVSYMKKILG